MRNTSFYIGLVMGLLLIIFLTGCGTYSGKDIAKSIEKISKEETQNYIPLPSNRRVNEEKKRANSAISTYSEHFGYYLKQFNNKIEEMSDFFYDGKPTEKSLEQVKRQVYEIQSLSDHLASYKLPKELTGLNNINISTLRELNLLTTALEEMNLQNPETFQRAKLHFENTVISLSLTEREYLTILTDYGLK